MAVPGFTSFFSDDQRSESGAIFSHVLSLSCKKPFPRNPPADLSLSLIGQKLITCPYLHQSHGRRMSTQSPGWLRVVKSSCWGVASSSESLKSVTPRSPVNKTGVLLTKEKGSGCCMDAWQGILQIPTLRTCASLQLCCSESHW